MSCFAIFCFIKVNPYIPPSKRSCILQVGSGGVTSFNVLEKPAVIRWKDQDICLLELSPNPYEDRERGLFIFQGDCSDSKLSIGTRAILKMMDKALILVPHT